MFESLVSDILNRFLGTYIENLDSSKLKISIWGGDVILQDLIIKQSALDALELPLKSLWGHLKCFRLKIPWSKLYTEKWEVILDGISLLVVPNTTIPYDPVKEEKQQYLSKLAVLKRIEEIKQRKKLDISGKDTKDQDSFMEKLFAQIIKNIEIEVSNIHIRYEDNFTLPTNPFSAGIILKKLSIMSTDKSWNIGLDTDRLIYKLLKLEGFLVYWTPESELYSRDQENFERFSSNFSLENTKYNYIPVLGPLDLSIQLQLNMNPQNDDPPFSVPKIFVNITVEKLPVGISRLQFKGIVSLMGSLELQKISSNFRKYRPKVHTIHGFSNLWWQYAYDCVLEDIKRVRQNWSWKNMKLHRQRSKRYKILYKLRLNGYKMNQDQEVELEQIEKALDVFNITLCRRQAEVELEREGPHNLESEGKKGWFGGWFSWTAKGDKTEDLEGSSLLVKRLEEEMTSKEKSQLYEAIGYSEDLMCEMPPEYVNFLAIFFLEEIVIKLKDEILDDCIVMLASARSINCTFSGRSASEAIKIDFLMSRFDVKGFDAEYLDDRPVLVESLDVNEKIPLIKMSYETNPLNQIFNTSIYMKAQPLSIVYHASTVSQVTDIFSSTEDISIQQLQVKALTHLEKVKERSVAGLQAAIDARSIIDLNIYVCSSRIIFPQFGCSKPDSSLIVMNLGSVSIKSQDVEKNDLQEADVKKSFQEFMLEKMRSSSYDGFYICLKNIQIIVVDKDDDWISVLNDGQATFHHLLQPLTLNINLYKCIVSGDPNLPKIKIDFQLPELKVSIVEKRIVKAAAIFSSCFSDNGTTKMQNERSQFIERKDVNQNLLTEDVALSYIEESVVKRPESSEATVQFIELVINFTIIEMTLEMMMNREDEKCCDPLMKFSVAQIALNFVKKTFDIIIEASLDEISAHYLVNGCQPLVTTYSEPGASNHLLSIKILMVDPKNPDFHAVHKSLTKQMFVNAENLEVKLEQLALLNLISFMKRLQEDLASIFPAVQKEEENHENITLTCEKTGLDKKGFKQQCSLNILNVKLVFSKLDSDLYAFQIKGLDVHLQLYKFDVEIKSKLEEFSLIDCNSKAVHKQLITSEEQQAWNASINLYEKDPHSQVDNVNQFDIECQVEVGAIRVTLLKQSFLNLMHWFDSLQVAKEAVLNASEFAAKSAKESISDSYSQGQKIKLDLILKAPLVFIPRHSSSLCGILFDFGRLTVKNYFRIQSKNNNSNQCGLFEEISLDIQDVKISRKQVWWESNEKLILDPLSLKIDITKNLSFSWLKENPEIEVTARLDLFQVRISEDDISCIWAVIQGNLQEPSETTTTTETHSHYNKDSNTLMQGGSIRKTTVVVESEKVFKRFTFQFLISEISLTLFTSDEKLNFEEISQHNEEFAEFSIRGLNIRSNVYSDFTIGANLILVDCVIEEISKDNENEIRVMLEKKKVGLNETILKPLIDVTFHQGKKNDVFFDLRINEISLILYLPFLLRISKFLMAEIPQDLQSEEESEMTFNDDISRARITETSPEFTEGNILDLKSSPSTLEIDRLTTVHIVLEKPDVILVENVSSINTSCIFSHAEINIDAKISLEQRNVSATIRNFEIYTSIFNPLKRNSSLFQVLKKSDFYILESTTVDHKSNVQLKIDDLNFRFSPGIVEVVSNILSCFSTEPDHDAANKVSNLIDWTDLWLPKPFDLSFLTNFDIDTVEEATSDLDEKLSETAIEALDSSITVGKEALFLEVDCVVITIETGRGSFTIPLIKMQSGCSLTAQGFLSPKMSFGGQISCEIVYFNSRHATWEPCLEPIERKKSSGENFDNVPWRLHFEGHLTLDSSKIEKTPLRVHVLNSSSSDIEAIEMDVSSVLNKLSVTSKDPLEFTVTKTFLQVLSDLLDSYVAAYKRTLPCKTTPSAPYRFINKTGENIVIDLKQSEVMITSVGDSDIENLILESEGEVDLYEKVREKSLCHQRHSSLVAQFQDVTERLIHIKIMETNENCIIPVKKADKRFFQITRGDGNSKFGLVSSIAVEGGCKIITLSGCVKISNELELPVDVYYMSEEGGTDLKYVFSINANEQQFLPIHAVNVFSSELFFAVKGYSVCITPVTWNRLQNYSCLTESLQCHPKTSETGLKFPFLFFARCDVEQIFWKNTTLRTLHSVMININLKTCIIFHNLLPNTLNLVLSGESEKRVLSPGSSVSVNHAKIEELNLKATVVNYRGISWSCTKETSLNYSDLNAWTFYKSGNESKERLHLGSRLSITKGVQHLCLFCPFWMVNKTGYDLYYTTDTSMQPVEHRTNDDPVILFSHGAKCLLGKKQACVKLKDSEWSEKFPLDAVGSSSAVTCKSLHDNNVYQISVNIQLSCSGLTKIVTFLPFYKAMNLCPYNLQFCLAGSTTWNAIETGKCLPIWPLGGKKALYLRVEGNSERTSLIHFDTAHSTLFKLNNKFGGVFIEVIETEGSILLNFDKCIIGASSALIINHLRTSSLSFWQEDHENEKIELNPQEMIYFTWESSESRRLLLFSCMGCSPLTIALNRDDNGIIEGGLAGWATWMEKAQRYLIVSEEESVLDPSSRCNPFESVCYDVEISFSSIGCSLINDISSQEIMYLSMSSSGVVWEHRKERGKKYRPFTEEETILLEKGYLMHTSEVKAFKKSMISRFTLKPQLEVDYSLMKVFKPFNRHIRRVFQPGVWTQMQIKTTERNFHMKINKLQIDNQLGSDVMFPVVLARVPSPSSVMAETVPKSFVEMSIIMSLDSALYRRFKYFSLLVQEFHLKVELPFLFSFLQAISNEEEATNIYTVEQFQKDTSVVHQSYTSTLESERRPSRRDFYHHLHLSPIKMHLSFSLTGLDKYSDMPLGGQVLQLFLQSVGVTLTEVEDVVFRLGFFERQNCWLNIEGFQSEVISHYRNQILKQIYVLILGLDVLGNPFGLALGVTKGFGDLFYEPIQGAVEGPSEFAEGIFYGMRSFMGKTVGGAALAFSRITGTIGKGVASLTLDEDYQRRRREDMHKKPTDSLESFARSGKGVISGVFDGVTGVFTKPIQGAKQEGVEGFFKGFGKGVLGLVTRPTSGMIDFASGSFDAIMRATNSVEDILPVRPSRYICQDEIIRPYSLLESSGHKLLKELEKGKFSETDTYVCHALVREGRNILLATDKRLFYLSRNDILAQWKVEWTHLYDELAESPTLEGTKIKILTKQSKRNVFGNINTLIVKKEMNLLDSADLTRFEKITDAYRKSQENQFP